MDDTEIEFTEEDRQVAAAAARESIATSNLKTLMRGGALACAMGIDLLCREHPELDRAEVVAALFAPAFAHLDATHFLAELMQGKKRQEGT